MYRIVQPHETLRPYIDCYWMVRAPQPILLRENIFVDGKADILFNFGCAYERHYLDQSGAFDRMARSNVDGQRKSPVGIVQQGAVNLVGVRFKAGGLAAFVACPAHELSNLTVDTRDLFGDAIDTLEAQLYDVPPDEQVDLLDTFFLRRLHLSTPYLMTLHLAQRLANATDDLAIWQLCREAGYSFRSVDRFFRQFFGIPPKFYARIVRFQRALAMLPNTRLTLSEIAFACGYYDQAHLTREFQALAAQPPHQYRVHLLEKLAIQTPNLVEFL